MSREVFLDTNVVLRLVMTSSPEHTQIKDAISKLESQGATLCIGLQVLVEMWVVATRPASVNGFGWSASMAQSVLASITSRFSVLVENSATTAQWLTLVSQGPVLGKRAHDAKLAALMLSHNINELLTLNVADFSNIPGITPLHPASIP